MAPGCLPFANQPMAADTVFTHWFILQCHTMPKPANSQGEKRTNSWKDSPLADHCNFKPWQITEVERFRMCHVSKIELSTCAMDTIGVPRACQILGHLRTLTWGIERFHTTAQQEVPPFVSTLPLILSPQRQQWVSRALSKSSKDIRWWEQVTCQVI